MLTCRTYTVRCRVLVFSLWCFQLERWAPQGRRERERDKEGLKTTKISNEGRVKNQLKNVLAGGVRLQQLTNTHTNTPAPLPESGYLVDGSFVPAPATSAVWLSVMGWTRSTFTPIQQVSQEPEKTEQILPNNPSSIVPSDSLLANDHRQRSAFFAPPQNSF